MATEHGSAGPLRAGWRMAKVGVWIGLFGLATELVGVLFGDAARWEEKLIAMPLWVAVFFVGGVAYSFLLPASVRERPGRTLPRMATGALAGAIAALPHALAGAILSGDLVGLTFAGILVPIAAILGAVVAGIAARFRAPSEDGPGASSRLVDPS